MLFVYVFIKSEACFYSEVYIIFYLWEYLKTANKPIVLYGMGDGADKLLNVCDKKGIKISGIFASDGFVRGHSFRGFKVKTLAETQSLYSDFIILLAFGSKDPDTIKMLCELSQKHELYAPDLPVFGTELFDSDFYNANKSKIDTLYNLFADEESKQVLNSILEYKLSGKLRYLFNAHSDVCEAWNILNLSQNETYLDAGAYNGDTVLGFTETVNNQYNHIYAYEPDSKNFVKLEKNIKNNDIKNITLFNSGLWSEDTALFFNKKAARGSSLITNGNAENLQKVTVLSIDSHFDDIPLSYIKFDVEGAELEAIAGARNIIKRTKPKLNIALYHKAEDLFKLPLLIKDINPDYKFYLRKHPSIPAWDINLYCV